MICSSYLEADPSPLTLISYSSGSLNTTSWRNSLGYETSAHVMCNSNLILVEQNSPRSNPLWIKIE